MKNFIVELKKELREEVRNEVLAEIKNNSRPKVWISSFAPLRTPFYPLHHKDYLD